MGLTEGKYKIRLYKKARKDKVKIASKPVLKRKVAELLKILEQDPFKIPPRFKKLDGDLKGYYSRRINKQHRLVYMVDRENREVKIASMWSHYSD